MSRKPLDGTDVVDQHWPATGPFDDESLAAAAAAVAQLQRYLAHGTFAAQGGLQYAADGYLMIGRLSTAAHSEDQMLRQVAAWADRLTVDPTLRIVDGSAETARVNAIDASETLREAAHLAAALAEKLSRVQSALSPLYHDQ